MLTLLWQTLTEPLAGRGHHTLLSCFPMRRENDLLPVYHEAPPLHLRTHIHTHAHTHTYTCSGLFTVQITRKSLYLRFQFVVSLIISFIFWQMVPPTWGGVVMYPVRLNGLVTWNLCVEQLKKKKYRPETHASDFTSALATCHFVCYLCVTFMLHVCYLCTRSVWAAASAAPVLPSPPAGWGRGSEGLTDTPVQMLHPLSTF